MSVKVMSWVWDHSRSKKTERLVLLAIADCASDDGANAYPSMAELMRKTGLSERGVQYAVKNLMTMGELFVSANGGPRGCNRYRVIMSTPQAVPPAEFAPPPQILRDTLSDSSQVWNVTPADPAPRTVCTPPQTVRQTPADPAPGTVLEPSEISSSKRSSMSTQRRRGTRIPDDFTVTPDMVTWARTTVPQVDGRRETEKFVNYWRAKSTNATKLDWAATWRNWMLTAAERLPQGRAAPHQPYRNPEDMSVYEEGL